MRRRKKKIDVVCHLVSINSMQQQRPSDAKDELYVFSNNTKSYFPFIVLRLLFFLFLRFADNFRIENSVKQLQM